MITPKDSAIVGAFMMEGVRDECDYGNLLDNWDKGCYEFVYELTNYAEYCWNLAEAGHNTVDEFPGIYDYEVSSVFGSWFAARVMETGNGPNDEECRAKLLDLAKKFFVREGEDLPHVLTALESVK